MSSLNFRIESSPKAFDILASNLYSDKISAVIRELSCNAADAHTEAGISEIPFKVFLPTQAQPFFIIRDFASGLRAEQIEDVFTVFFSSTKAGSKAYTGAFGLGCKSPFAITDKFLVNSYVDGKKYFYHCIRKDGIPSISLIEEKIINTNEYKSGLEIIIPLTIFSVDEWHTKAKNIYEVFKVRPTTNVKLDYFTEEPEYKCGNNWDNTSSNDIWVVMNNVRYRLDMSKIDQKLINKDVGYRTRGIRYYVPPRSVEVTPSREEISYTKETIDFLNNFISKVNKDFYDSIQNELGKAKSKINAQIKYVEIRKNFHDEYFNSDKFFNPLLFTWNGEPLSASKWIDAQIKYTQNIEIGFYYKISKYTSNVKSKLYTNVNVNFINETVDENLFFIINDTKASKESITAWANKKFKLSNKSTISFVVVRGEYAFILTEHNKIESKFILKCSEFGLQKVARVSTKVKRNSSEVLLHTYNVAHKTITSNEGMENDIIEDLVDEKNIVYFISYKNIFCSSFDHVYIADTGESKKSLRSLDAKISCLKRNSRHLPVPFETNIDKVLLIKDLKKNKDFMKKYSKQNKIRFVSYQDHVRSIFESYCLKNVELLNFLADGFAFNYWLSNAECAKDCTDDFDLNKKLYQDKFNERLQYVCEHIESLEPYKNQFENLSQIYSFVKSHFDSMDRNYGTIINSIHYLYQNFCDNNIQKFQELIMKYCHNALVKIELIEKFCKENSAIFLTSDEKTDKIIEYYMTGKIT